jgi:DNA-binding SARP family transcriptional activator/tetratricopeptide (TPR) repeat protein
VWLVEFRLLGPTEVWAHGSRLDLGSPQQRTVLAALLVDAGRTVAAETLIDRVWGEGAPVGARRALHVYIARIRQVLMPLGGALGLVRRSSGYVVEVDPVLVDWHRFRSLVASAGDGRVADEERARLLREALDLWQGTPLADVPSDWAALTRERWRQQRLDAAVRWAEVELRLGRHDRVVGPVRDLLADHPLVEPLAAALLRALALAGRPAEALERYAAMRAHLSNELGTDPGHELRELHGAILRGEMPSAGLAPAALEHGVPAQLPPDVRGFAARREHLARLDAMLEKAGDEPTAAVIAAVSGTAGVGKTALALRWAHGAASRFPDGQLYVDLRGFDRDDRMMSSDQAVRGFLDALGVTPQRVPVDPEAQVALYRSLMAGRRMLVVLDNARDAEQVRPLLPGSPTTMVVITSRSRLTPLVATHGAHSLTLDLLSRAEARELLARRLGAGRVTAEPEAVGEIMSVCAGLPLALAIAAARAEQTSFPLATLAADLWKAGLDGLDAGGPASQVRTVLSWSYAALSPAAARLFRLLGLHCGPDITAVAAASLAGQPASEARRLLNELAHASLLTEHLPGRFRFHDLLRAFAADVVREVELDDDRHAAMTRLLDHYTHTANAADQLIRPNDSSCLPLGEAAAGTRPESLVEHSQAMSWFAANLPVLLTMLRHAAAHGFDRQAWQLARVTDTFVHMRGYPQEQVASWQTALRSAQRLGHTGALAYTYKMLAHAHMDIDYPSEGRRYLRQALALYTPAGDRIGQADVHRQLAKAYEREGRHDRSLDHAREALVLYRAAGASEAKVACALNGVGWQLAQLGRPAEARSHCEQALAVYQRLDHRFGQGVVSDSLGYVHHHLGDIASAEKHYQHALTLFRELGAGANEAETLTRLGDAYLAASSPEAAGAAWTRALAILAELHHPNTRAVRSKLDRVRLPAVLSATY